MLRNVTPHTATDPESPDMPARWRLLLIFVLAAGLTLTLLVFAMLQRVNQVHFTYRFATQAQEQVALIAGQFRAYQREIDAVRRFFLGSEHVDRQEFADFVAPILATDLAHAVAWVPRVAGSQRVACELAAAADGQPGYQIVEWGPSGERMAAGARDAYFPVFYVEGLDTGPLDLGFDLAAEPIRRAALTQALALGDAVASEPLPLIHDSGGEPAVLIFHPVRTASHQGVYFHDDGDDLAGFVVGMQRPANMIAGLLKRTAGPTLRLRVVATGDAGPPRPLFQSAGGDPRRLAPARELVHRADYEWGGRSWRIEARPTEAFTAMHHATTHWWALLAGLALTSLLTLGVNYRGRMIMLREARDFRNLFEQNGCAMLLIEPEHGRIADANPAAATFYGYPRTELRHMLMTRINDAPPDVIARERERAMRAECNYFVFPHRLANGEIRMVEVYAHPVTIGSSALLLSIIHDISARHLRA